MAGEVLVAVNTFVGSESLVFLQRIHLQSGNWRLDLRQRPGTGDFEE